MDCKQIKNENGVQYTLMLTDSLLFRFTQDSLKLLERFNYGQLEEFKNRLVTDSDFDISICKRNDSKAGHIIWLQCVTEKRKRMISEILSKINQ